MDTHLSLSTRIQKETRLPVMLHIAVAQLSRGDCVQVLDACRGAGIVNIMALRGDFSANKACKPHEEGFVCARDFVAFIRASYGDYFCVAVAGYPGL